MSEEIRDKKRQKAEGRRQKLIGFLITIHYSLFAAVLLFTVHCLLFTAVYAAGGDIVWQYGDTPQTGKQEAAAMAVDSAGNTIITGASDQTGNNDYYTIKINADGNGVLWSKVYDKAAGDDHATAIAVDSDNNVIVTGYVWNGSNYDYHTIKYNGSDGTVLWQHTFNAAVNGNDYATAITVDSLNNVYVGGNSQGPSGSDDYMIVKYGSAGPNPDDTPIWQKSYNGTANGHDRITSITAGINGIAVTGTSQNSTPDFDLLTVTYGFDSTLIWEKRKSVSGDDRGVAVRMDSAGNILVTASVYNGIDKDIYTAKYNGSTGEVTWEITFNGGYDDVPAAIYIDSFNDVYITGNIFVLSGAIDIYTAKYDGTTGALQWGHIFNSFDGYQDRAVSISGDNAGSIFVAGDTYNEDTANYDYQTLKYTAGGGTLLWQKGFNGTAGKNDRVVGLGLTAAGESIVGGWTDKWTSGASDYDYYAIKYDPGLINPPTGLAASTVSNSEITLAWTDNSSNEDGFKIERKIGELGTYSQIATVGASVTTYNNTGLTSDTKYYYRVKAYNAANGDSQYSNEDYAVTTVVSYTSPAWTYIYNGSDNGDDYVTAITAGPDNGPVATGYSYSAAGQFDYYTVKINRETGGTLWGARYNGDQDDMDVARTITADSNNDVLVSGYSYLYGGGAGNTNDIYSLRYPSTGEPEDWTDQYNGPAGDDDRSSVVDVTSDGNNDYVVVGYGKNASWNDDIYVIKYLNNGTRSWAATPYDGGSNDYPAAVAFDSSGNIFVTGYTKVGLYYNYFTRKYNGSTGAVIWTDVFNGAGTGDDFTRSLAVDSSGNVYITGSSVTASGNEDFYTIKYNGATGARLWERSHNGAANGTDEAISVKADPQNGEVVVAGTVFTSSGNNDFHVIRYDTDGNVLWQRTLDRPSYDDFVTAAAMDRSGNIHIAGFTDAGAGTDILSIWYDTEGTFSGGMTYNGAANGNDEVSSITINNMGEAFIAGHTTNSNGNADYIVLKVIGYQLQPPAPLNAAPSYTSVALTWSDNSAVEDGYYVERKVGACDSGNPWVLINTTAANATSYSDTLLNTGSQYCYRVQAFRNNGETSVWTEKVTTTLSPSAPGDFSATAANTTQINLSWTDNTSAEDGFRIERCSGTGCSNFAELTTVAVNTTTYQDTSVCNATAYSYRVVAYKTGQWESAYSGTSSVTATTAAVPGNFAASRASEVQINLSWTDTTSDETGFRIDRCTGAGCSDFAELTSVAAGTTTYNNTGLAYGTTYTYRVRAYKTATCSWETTSATAAATTSVAAPSGLSSSSPNTTQINLSWTDTTASETGFKIERCTGAGCSDFAEIGTAAANATSYQDTSVCSASTYQYRVRATRSGEWDSGYSSTVSRSTGTPAAPGSLTIPAITEVKIDLSWSDATSDETGFKIERCTGVGCSDFAEIATVNANTITYSNTGLLPSTSYSYRVRAYKTATCNGGWNTGYSIIVTGNTTTVPPPSGLAATPANTTQVNLAWTDNTGSETGFKVEKCTGAGCSNFAELTKLPRNTTSYADTSVCNTTDYRYRVKAINEGLSNGEGGCWTRRVPLAITNFQADFQTKVTVTHDADMQADFDDLRFYDTTSFAELPHWIESKTDGVSATVWVKTGANNTVYMYYGNPSATSISNGSVVFEFFDNFTGTTINAAKWTEIDPNNSIAQNDGLILNDVSDAWDKALISNQTITRAASKMIYAKLTIAADTPGNNHMMMGWELNQTANPSYNQLVHGLYWNNYSFLTYEKGTSRGGSGTYTANTTYEMKIELKATGAMYYIKGGAYASWTLVRDNTIYSDATMRVAFTHHSHQATVHFITVQKYTATEPSVSSGAEETSACYTYDITWETQPSNEAAVTTPAITASVLSTAAVGDTFINLSWTDAATDETGFVLERCAGVGCSDFTTLTSPGAGVTTYSDTGLTLGQSYSYRIKAFKTATCGWDTEYGNVITETTLVMPPSGLGASAANTTQINLSWTDNSGSETGFRIERCTGTGCSDFTQINTVGANVVTYNDTTVCNATSYSYRVRAYKTGEWDSNYSVPATAVTATPGTPVLTATRASEVQINLSWADNTSDETGFKIDRCTGDACSDFSEIASVGANTTTYNNTGLTYSTEYAYRVRAYKTATCSWEKTSNAPTATTSIAVPSGFAASSPNTTEINLSWTDNTASETGFKIERCAGSGCSDFAQITTVGANIVTYQDTSVCNGTSYSYRIRAYRTSPSWDSDYSSTASSATSSVTAPGSFSAIAVTDTLTDITWTDNTSDETGFSIERCAGQGCSNYTELTTTAANATSYSDTGLTPSETYCYRVRAYKTATCGWNTVYSTQSCDQTYSAAPNGLTATPINSMLIQLNWTDNSNDEDGYELQVKIWNGKYVNIATLAADTVMFNDTMSIEPEKQYTYRVRAFRGADNSPYSAEASTTTPAYQTGDDTCQ